MMKMFLTLLATGAIAIQVTQTFALPPGDGFDFANFSSTAGLNLVGDTAQFNTRLRLTPAEFGKVGGAWFSDRQRVIGGFRTSFQFEVSQPDPNFGADGFAFIVQDDSATALGAGGSSLGFMDIGDGPGLDNFLAVEFDTHNSGITFDTNGNHIAIQTRRKNPPKDRQFLGSATPPFSIQGGGVHSAQIIYESLVLSVFVDNEVSPLLAIDLDLAALLDSADGKAWVGFTGATGGAWENHDILSWSFTSSRIPEPGTLFLALPCLAFAACRLRRTRMSPDPHGSLAA